MVCTSQPLAAQAGLDMLKKGGNAVDAAVAVASALTVLEPTGNGLGSDAFALVWMEKEKRLYGLNASGPAPMGLDPDTLRKKYGSTMPKRGWDTVTVPGAVSAWSALSYRFGRLSFEKLLSPAIGYARGGYPVSPMISKLWNDGFRRFQAELKEESQQPWFATFVPNGRAPQPGEVVTLPWHAATLEELASTGGESLYRGKLAERIDQWARKTGGVLRKEDLESFYPEWVEPISTDYRGYTVSEIPPNGHGIVALMALNIMEGFQVDGQEVERVHRQIESMKLAFADGQRYVTDPGFMRVTPEQMLSKEYAARRRALIGHDALTPEPGDPACGGTVYLCTADQEGNMVSYIQSNYMGFGSGVVIPETGISLQNRGNNFSLDPQSENCAAPGKKPYHTIIPGFLSKGGRAVGPFGVMGGFMQPQGHFQVILNTIDHGMNPQEVLDAPRWQWVGGKRVEVERAFPYDVTEALIRRGHEIKVVPESHLMGRGQIIWRNEEGVLMGATEPRADGVVAAW